MSSFSLKKTLVTTVAAVAIVSPMATGLAPASASVAATAVTTKSTQHSALSTYRAALRHARAERRVAFRTNQHVFQAAVANARVARDQALAAATSSADRLNARIVFRSTRAAARTDRIAANDNARTAFDSALEQAAQAYIASSASTNKQALVDYVNARHTAWAAFGVTHRADRGVFIGARDSALTTLQAALAAAKNAPNRSELRRDAWQAYRVAMHSAWLTYRSAEDAAIATRIAAIATARAAYVAATQHQPVI